MLWPVILPIQITAYIIGSLIVTATLVAPLAKWRRQPILLGASLLGMLAFVPSCMGIMSALDARRFGVFGYASFADVNDARVQRYLPPDARNVTVDKYPEGFRARYAITHEELMSYLDELWAKHGDRSVVPRGVMSAAMTVDGESFKLRFGDLGWPPLEGASEYCSPIAANGAGFSVWYSPKERIAYQRTGYW